MTRTIPRHRCGLLVALLFAASPWLLAADPPRTDAKTAPGTAYAPGIANWDKGRVFTTYHWVDAGWSFPPPAAGPAGTLAFLPAQDDDATELLFGISPRQFQGADEPESPRLIRYAEKLWGYLFSCRVRNRADCKKGNFHFDRESGRRICFHVADGV